MISDIDTMLSEIENIQQTNRALAHRKLRSDYELLLRFIFAAIFFLFVATGGYDRCRNAAAPPTGIDLLFFIYLSRFLGGLSKK